MTFGRSEYDCVTFQANLENIADAWNYCLDNGSKQLIQKYQAFTDWFLSEYAIDLSQPKCANKRLDVLANTILAELSA